MYFIFMTLGCLAAWLLVRVLSKDGGIVTPAMYITCLCGAFTGAFLLRPLSRVFELIFTWEAYRDASIGEITSFLFGEFVFYGGLIGGTVALLVYCKIALLPPLELFDVAAPAVALGHAFGRVGCFFAGCCYGIPGIQLIEALCLLVISAVLVLIYKKSEGHFPPGTTICVYGILYGIARFVIEFFRQDTVRGIYGAFSLSQYISILIVLTAAVYLVTRTRRETGT